MASLLSDESKNSDIMIESQKFINQNAKLGLRTLLLAKKHLTEEEYDEWNQKAQKAYIAVNDRE